jgi:hypothetical protein
MSRFGRGSAGWWEVMRVSALAISEVKGGGGRCVGCKRAAAVGRLHPEEEESRAGPCSSERRGGVGWVGREAEA